MSEIVDHKRDGSAVSRDDIHKVSFKKLQQQSRETTKGWKRLVQWKDGTSTSIPLKDLKHSNPIEVAEYAVANKIIDEPAFSWWAQKFLRKRVWVISKVKSRYWEWTHKYRVAIPKSVEEALRIDGDTGTKNWQKAIEREMKAISVLFVNKAPILWYSKGQNTVETSTFGSEFCAMKTAIDMIEGLRY